MTITQLETFSMIAEAGSFSAAAARLGYAQSTVTTQIRLLEEELGSILFDRLGKNIILTASGHKLKLYSEQLLQLEREIRMEVPEGGEPAGVLKLGVSESLCYKRLPNLLMRYKERFPGMEIQLRFVTHDTFPELLRKGELDLVYTINPLIEEDYLHMLCKRTETLGFYAALDHPLARKKKIKEEDLKGVPLLLTGHNCSFRHMLLKDLERAGVTPEIAIETSSKEVLKQFAKNALGVAFLPDMTAEEEIRQKQLVRLKWAGENFPVYSQVFIHKDKHRSRAVTELVKMIKE